MQCDFLDAFGVAVCDSVPQVVGDVGTVQYGRLVAQRVRRQHVVSQFYLKGFASDSARVKRLELPGERTIVLATSDATVIKDFYTVDLSDGTPSDMFEKFFSQFEGEAAEAIGAVAAGVWPLSADRRMALASWMALQYLRGQEIRSGQRALDGFHIRLLVGASGKKALRALIEEREGAAISDEELDWEWQDLTKPGGPDLEADPIEHLVLLMDLLPGLTEHLSAWHWTLIHFERQALGTSDHPVSLVAGRDHRAGMGVGIATAGLVYVPLTRRDGLTIQPRDRFPGQLGFVPDVKHPGTTQIARSLNQEAARSAKRYVYFHPDDDPFRHPVVLPSPREHGWSDSGADSMISEGGFFRDLTDKDESVPSPVGAAPSGAADASAGSEGGGMTLSDLTWPIPRRIGTRPASGSGGGPSSDAGAG